MLKQYLYIRRFRNRRESIKWVRSHPNFKVPSKTLGLHTLIVPKNDDDYKVECNDPDCLRDCYYTTHEECVFENEDDNIYEKVFEQVPDKLRIGDYILKPGRYMVNLELDGDVDDYGRSYSYMVLDFKKYKG